MHLPYLIVGQGLAGTVLAIELHKRGHLFAVADADLPSAASTVAAGAFNPVTGKRMQLTWNANTLWPILEAFYPQAEKLLGKAFFYPLPNLRPLFTEKERQEAEKYARSGSLAPWVTVSDTIPWQPTTDITAPLGALVVPRAGFVDVRAFCQAARRWLQTLNAFIPSQVAPAECISTQEGIVFKNKTYKAIIWAEGFRGKDNPLLQTLPLAPLKGEILRLQPNPMPTLSGGVLNRAAYLAPRPDGTLWAGSTYEHHYTTPNPTEEGKASILERISRFYTPQVTVVEHMAGIRPSVLDRRPIIGPLPSQSHHFVFTGLGTKGVSLAPWLAQILCDNLEKGNPIPQDIAVRTLAHPQPNK